MFRTRLVFLEPATYFLIFYTAPSRLLATCIIFNSLVIPKFLCFLQCYDSTAGNDRREFFIDTPVAAHTSNTDTGGAVACLVGALGAIIRQILRVSQIDLVGARLSFQLCDASQSGATMGQHKVLGRKIPHPHPFFWSLKVTSMPDTQLPPAIYLPSSGGHTGSRIAPEVRTTLQAGSQQPLTRSY